MSKHNFGLTENQVLSEDPFQQENVKTALPAVYILNEEGGYSKSWGGRKAMSARRL